MSWPSHALPAVVPLVNQPCCTGGPALPAGETAQPLPALSQATDSSAALWRSRWHPPARKYTSWIVATRGCRLVHQGAHRARSPASKSLPAPEGGCGLPSPSVRTPWLSPTIYLPGNSCASVHARSSLWSGSGVACSSSPRAAGVQPGGCLPGSVGRRGRGRRAVHRPLWPLHGPRRLCVSGTVEGQSAGVSLPQVTPARTCMQRCPVCCAFNALRMQGLCSLPPCAVPASPLPVVDTSPMPRGCR